MRIPSRNRMAVVAGVPLTDVSLTATTTSSGGTLLTFLITPPGGTTVESLQAQIEASASGSGGLASYFTAILDPSLTIIATSISSTAALIPSPPSMPSPAQPLSSGDDLDGGAIAGIVVGSVLGFLLLIFLAFAYSTRHRKRLAVATITPDVGERALVQPPPLPADNITPPGTAPAPAPSAEGAGTETCNDRVPLTAPVSTT